MHTDTGQNLSSLSSAGPEEGNRSRDIDLPVADDMALTEVVKALRTSQETLGREINPTLYPMKESRSRVSEGHYFIRNVLNGPKTFVTGNEDDLKRLAG